MARQISLVLSRSACNEPLRFPLQRHLAVHCTIVMDCCHSGTVADLPYTFGADDAVPHVEAKFDTRTAEELQAHDAEEEAALARAIAAEALDVADDDHAEPLPYDPEHGFLVRPARKSAQAAQQPGPQGKPKNELPAPPPQCCSIL